MADSFLHLLPIYPLLAQQILDDYQMEKGRCIDIGTGHGYLGIELAKITDLEMYFIDIKKEALEQAEKNAVEAGLQNILCFIQADVTALPFENNFADLIISRGSLWFWEDKVQGLQEIYRVIKPGGTALVGGGLGRYTPTTMRKRLKGRSVENMRKSGGEKLSGDELVDLMHKTGIENYTVVSDVPGEAGTWIEMKK